MSSNGICIFGEVLFDLFPDGSRVLGGAPFNVAWHLQAFGQSPLFVSRVGTDEEGEQIRSAMRDWGMNCDYLQHDAQLPSGRVNVTIEDNEPSYDIQHPCAYDRIDASGIPRQPCRILYHGSLALRDERSRLACERLKHLAHDIIFVDVNLRPPWWRPEQIETLLHNANWVKLNIDEMIQLGEREATAFMQKYQLAGLVLTRGSAGAQLLTADGRQTQVVPEASTSVVDTVGAGDAFASVVLLGLASDWSLDETAKRAQQFASATVSQRGATNDDTAFYQSFIEHWQLNI